MIPYVNFGATLWAFKPTNPFVVTDEPLRIFIDRLSLNDSSDLDFLLRQGDGKNLFLVSTERDGNAQLVYGSMDDAMIGFSIANLDRAHPSRYGMDFVQFKSLAASPQFARWGTPDEIERAFLAAKTAEAMHAHIFITGDKFLLENKNLGFIANSFPLNLTDGIALAGLVQRRHGNFKITIDRQKNGATITQQYSRWLFFWYASRDLLPAAWKLVTGCSQMPDDNRCRDLALRAIARMSNVLKCRDHIHEQLFLEQSSSSTEDAVFYLDFYLVSLVAAFDVLARVADAIYAPTDSKGKRIRKITWRDDKKWLKKLEEKDRKLAGLMAPETPDRDVLEFIASLRNYIHAEGLHGAAHTRNGETAPTLLQIPPQEVDDIANIISRLFGSTWTVDRPKPDIMFLEIGELVERMTPLAAKALNDLMETIDVTKIAGYDPSVVETKAPASWPTSAELLDIRRLFGL